MLYDPKWKTRKTVTPSIDGFIAWLETQSPEVQYPWESILDCVVCRYLTAVTGLSRLQAEGANAWPFLSDVFPSMDVYFEVCGNEPHTNEAALERARQVQSR